MVSIAFVEESSWPKGEELENTSRSAVESRF